MRPLGSRTDSRRWAPTAQQLRSLGSSQQKLSRSSLAALQLSSASAVTNSTLRLSPPCSLSQSSRSDSLARLSGDCWCRQPSTAEPQPRVAPLRWGLARRRVCGYSLIGLPGLHATDSSPKLVSRVRTGHMWVSTQFMPPHHPPIFSEHSPVGCTMPCRSWQ